MAIHFSSPLKVLLASALVCAALASAQQPAPKEDTELDQQLQTIAAAHHGKLAVYARNLKTGETASLDADQPVKTASTIKMGILLDAAEQIRAGHASLDEKLELTKANQVGGSGILGQLTAPMSLTLRDDLHLMVVLSDNTATNVAIDRFGVAQINATLRAAGLTQTVLYKKVFVPTTDPMPADQPQFGLGKTTAREMASIMQRLAECRLSLDGSAPLAGDGQLCAALLHSLRQQQDREDLPRYLEALDTSEHGSAIANKTGALDQVRNDVALIATKNGPVVIAAFTWDNADQRWTGDNEAQKTLAKVGQAVVERWSPHGLDAAAFPWDDPLVASAQK
jgi:beta-lactamase class A